MWRGGCVKFRICYVKKKKINNNKKIFIEYDYVRRCVRDGEQIKCELVLRPPPTLAEDEVPPRTEDYNVNAKKKKMIKTVVWVWTKKKKQKKKLLS